MFEIGGEPLLSDSRFRRDLVLFTSEVGCKQAAVADMRRGAGGCGVVAAHTCAGGVSVARSVLAGSNIESGARAARCADCIERRCLPFYGVSLGGGKCVGWSVDNVRSWLWFGSVALWAVSLLRWKFSDANLLDSGLKYGLANISLVNFSIDIPGLLLKHRIWTTYVVIAINVFAGKQRHGQVESIRVLTFF